MIDSPITSPAISAKTTPTPAPLRNNANAIGYVAYLGIGRSIPMIAAKGIAINKFFPRRNSTEELGTYISISTPSKTAMKKIGRSILRLFSEFIAIGFKCLSSNCFRFNILLSQMFFIKK